VIELTERDRSFMDGLRRFRVMSKPIIQDTYCEGSADAAKKLVARLKDFVASEPFAGNRKYYRLTPAGARLVGAPEEVGRPLGPQALAKALGVLKFCLPGSARRFRYTRPEFIQDFPEFVEELLGKDYYSDYYLDDDGVRVRFGRIVVDLGGDYQRLLQKCRGYIKRGFRTPGFRELLDGELFALAIVVSNVQKRQAIEDAVHKDPIRAWLRIEVVSELGELLLGGKDDVPKCSD
jgi:hypothetical protein